MSKVAIKRKAGMKPAHIQFQNSQKRGFEPPGPEGSPDYQSGALNRSATSLGAKIVIILIIKKCGKKMQQRMCSYFIDINKAIREINIANNERK